MTVNSTELLRVIESISNKAGDNVPIEIKKLADHTGLDITKLVSLLTELEQRDLVMLNLTTTTDAVSGELMYSGTIRMMEIPPDENNGKE